MSRSRGLEHGRLCPPSLLTTRSCTGPWGKRDDEEGVAPESPPAGERQPQTWSRSSGLQQRPGAEKHGTRRRRRSLEGQAASCREDVWTGMGGRTRSPGGQKGEIRSPGRGRSTSPHLTLQHSLSVRHPGSTPVRNPGPWDLEAGARLSLPAGGGETAERPRCFLGGLPVPACAEGSGL